MISIRYLGNLERLKINEFKKMIEILLFGRYMDRQEFEVKSEEWRIIWIRFIQEYISDVWLDYREVVRFIGFYVQHVYY